MLDLKKYLNRASADPGFRQKLLQNANQAIKDEFGEDLPYKLKCKEKIVFEVAPMDEMSDADLSSVAGGGPLVPLKEWEDNIKKDGFTPCTHIMPKRKQTGVYNYVSDLGGRREAYYSVLLVNLDGKWYVDTSTAQRS